jgi:hypothetical protein
VVAHFNLLVKLAVVGQAVSEQGAVAEEEVVFVLRRLLLLLQAEVAQVW